MRQETIVKTYLTFDELSERQKKKVIEKNQDINVDYDWWEHIKDDYEGTLETLGFTDVQLYFSGFWHQGDGASFTGKFEVPEKDIHLSERMANLIEQCPYFFEEDKSMLEHFINMDFSEEREDGEQHIEVFKRYNYEHSGTMFCHHKPLQEFCRYIADRYYKELEKQYYFLTDDEQVKETLIDNGYEFDTDTLEIV